jgi:hypothetical protein
LIRWAIESSESRTGKDGRKKEAKREGFNAPTGSGQAPDTENARFAERGNGEESNSKPPIRKIGVWGTRKDAERRESKIKRAGLKPSLYRGWEG